MKYLLTLALLILCSCDTPTDSHQKAVFSAGCFWGVQHTFREAPGVSSTRAGYTGGDSAPTSHFQAKKGGHVEAVEVIFDPTQTSYEELVKIFFKKS